MPTPYVGDPTAATAPDTVPAPETAPTINIPIATEGRTVSSVMQAMMALANRVAWAFKPKAKAGDINGHIMAYRNAAGHKRWAIDHHGFPAGRLNHVRDDLAGFWASGDRDSGGTIRNVGEDKLGVISRSINPAWRWFAVSQDNLSGEFYFGVEPSFFDGRPVSRSLNLYPGDTIGDYRWIARAAQSWFTTNNCVVLEFDAKIDFKTDPSCLTQFGLGEPGQPTNQQNGIFFVAANGIASGNWGVVVYNGGVPSSIINTGVAVTESQWYRFRVVHVGANVDDAGVGRVLFFIDGALEADILSPLPLATAEAGPVFQIERIGAGLPHKLVVGAPILYSSNNYPTDVL